MRGKGEGSIFKNANGLWTGIIELPSHNGTRRRKVIRRKLKQDLINEMISQRARLQREGDLPTNEQTVEQWFTYWLRRVTQKVRPNTAANYRNVTEKYIIPTIGHVKLSLVTGSTVRRVWEESMPHLSTTYQLNAQRIMSVAFEAAVKENRIPSNPAKKTDPPRKAASNLTALTLDEALTVLESVANDPLGARWAVALMTGARRGEVLALEADRITDVIDLTWQLQRLPRPASGTKPQVPSDYEYRHVSGGLYLTRPKSSASMRVIPMFEPLRSILLRHMELYPPVDGFVFTVGGKVIDPGQDSKNWRIALAKSGIDKDVRLHDLRHTAVDMLYLAGVPEDIIMMIVGHSVRATTRGYQSRNDDRMRAAMQRVGDMFTLTTPSTRQAIGG
jgi:integrase